MTDVGSQMIELDPQSAIEQWCDQTLVAEERRLRDCGYNGHTFNAIFGKETESDRVNDPLCRVVDKLRTELHYKLIDGELIGAGYVSGDMPETPRRDVQPNRWSVLRIDFENWSAEGSGIVLNDLRLRLPATSSVAQALDNAEMEVERTSLDYSAPLIRVVKMTHEVRVGDRTCVVSRSAFRLLMVMVQRLHDGDEPLSKSEIREKIFSKNTPDDAAYELVRQLRRSLDKLGVGEGKRLIRTVHGSGFALALERDQIILE